jgi:hypothetical protein
MAVNDLNQDSRKDKDFFYLTINDLEPGKEYPVQLRWQKEDGSRGLWSSSKILQSPDEADTALPVPHFTTFDVDQYPGTMLISWDGNDNYNPPRPITNIDHVGVFITDENDTFGDGTKEAASFKTAGRISIAAPGGTYIVKLASVSARGTIGTKTAGIEVVIQDGVPIELPKLAVGLEVLPAPFAIIASWGGAYSGDETFKGLKTINIYASESDLGPSTTATANPGLLTNLVGTMTVNDSPNKVTIGMDVLKQVLSIGNPAHSPTSAELYELPVFFYHLSVNDNGIPYKVDGETVFTRINSSGISPTKANLIDLENGLISIENLVAGNGQFQSWLRVGEPGTSRIELSSAAVNASEAGGYNVLQGLTVWKSGDTTPAFRADLSGNVAIGRFTAADLATIETTATDASAAASTADGKAVSASSAASAAAAAALAADQAAFAAQATATEAYNKVARFNANGSKVILGIAMDASGSIYSNKDSYSSSNAGWYLGNLISGESFTPVINVGSSDAYFKWDGSALEIKGKLTATSGAITGDFTVGNTVFKPTGNDGFLIEDADGKDILYIPTAGGRITLGHAEENIGRQVDVARSAQIAGGTENANSGGLRNMFTATENLYASNTSIYLTANPANGDVLLVYDPG